LGVRADAEDRQCTPYPLQYYFEFRTADAATLHPPFNPTFSNKPYYVNTSAT
jgi:hypothetical protein